MKVPQLSKLTSGQIVVDSTTIATVLTTDWMLAAGAANLLLWWDQQATSGGTFTTKARYRFASARTDLPGAWTTPATAGRTGDGQVVEAVDLSATTNQMWVQAGVGGYNVSGIAEAFVRMQSQVQGNGMLVATDVVEVQPNTNAGQTSVVGLGSRFPQGGITKLMFAYVFKGVSGTITYRPMHREFKGDAELPGAWTNLGAGDSTVTADGTANSGQLTIAPTAGYLFGQAGLKFSGDARGNIQVIVVAIY